MSYIKNYIFIIVILVLTACSNELKFEHSTAKGYGYYDWSINYRAFYLVDNYDDADYVLLQKFSRNEFNRIIRTNDSINFVQFDFYKKNLKTHMFLNSEDPYGYFSPLLQENDKKYGKYRIETIYYDLFEKNKYSKWVIVSMLHDITDTIEINVENLHEN